MKEIEVDVTTGVKTTFDYSNYEETGKVTVHREQDYEHTYDFANTLRKQNEGVKKSSDDHWNHYAIIPIITQLEMMKAGIDLDRDTKGVIQYINKHHPELKVSNLWHHCHRKGLLKDPKVQIR